jgi:hypothetical protein
MYGLDILLSDYKLFDPYYNIKLGANYLNILYNIKFKKIKDKKSRLYCTVMAYYSSIDLVFDILKDIEHINTLHPSYIYKLLMRKSKSKQLNKRFYKTIKAIPSKHLKN